MEHYLRLMTGNIQSVDSSELDIYINTVYSFKFRLKLNLSIDKELVMALGEALASNSTINRLL